MFVLILDKTKHEVYIYHVSSDTYPNAHVYMYLLLFDKITAFWGNDIKTFRIRDK